MPEKTLGTFMRAGKLALSPLAPPACAVGTRLDPGAAWRAPRGSSGAMPGRLGSGLARDGKRVHLWGHPWSEQGVSFGATQVARLRHHHYLVRRTSPCSVRWLRLRHPLTYP